MGLRKDQASLSADERERFVAALNIAKSNGTVDRFADIHAAHFGMGIHRSSHFLPWHREMILRFEKEMQRFDSEVTIPYWNSSVDSGAGGSLWDQQFLGQFDSAWGLNRRLGADTLPTPEDVEFTVEGNPSYGRFWPRLESQIHNPPHRWVGGVMARADSPRDPVFYLHHCWIDMLWARWQARFPGAEFEASGPGVGFTDPLMEWPERTPADVADHHALGYVYDWEPVPDGAHP